MSGKRTGAFSEEVKNAVLLRSKGRCEMCGTSSEAVHFHHRQPRQMGGTSNPLVGGADNALLLHPRCHDRVEKNRATSYLMGWLVTKQDDPAQVPVRLWDGWYTLGRDGTLSPTSPVGQAEGGSEGEACLPSA